MEGRAYTGTDGFDRNEATWCLRRGWSHCTESENSFWGRGLLSAFASSLHGVLDLCLSLTYPLLDFGKAMMLYPRVLYGLMVCIAYTLQRLQLIVYDDRRTMTPAIRPNTRAIVYRLVSREKSRQSNASLEKAIRIIIDKEKI